MRIVWDALGAGVLVVVVAVRVVMRDRRHRGTLLAGWRNLGQIRHGALVVAGVVVEVELAWVVVLRDRGGRGRVGVVPILEGSSLLWADQAVVEGPGRGLVQCCPAPVVH
jgi:hypothetical protein